MTTRGTFRILTLVAVLLAAVTPRGAGAQACTAPADAIRVIGAVDEPVTLTRDGLRGMERHTISSTDHDEVEHRWQGVTLRGILDRARVPGGTALHGRALSGYVVVEARDGYRATFALAELDGGYWDQLPILADQRDGESLNEHAGPFQVIVGDAPKHGRWVRQVACLRVAYPE